MCSGGYHHYESSDTRLQDRLYLNDGKGNFVKKPHALPSMLTSSSCVRVNDINNDGHLDLFVGGRIIPGRYPESPSCYVLINDGKGNFIDRTLSIAPSFRNIGMVTDAVWLDLNKDNRDDLVVVGDWMPLMVLLNNDTHLVDSSATFFDKRYSGCWNHILAGDFNKD